MEGKAKRIGLSGSTLKIIALITMIIDHTGYLFFSPPGRTYWILRGIGRLAFPIYCFLITEGYLHTRSVGKYLRNLLVFAVISEVPFDLMISGVPFDMRTQNVFFTLALGLMGIWAGDRASRGGKQGLMVLCYLAAGMLGYLLRTDYGAEGVCLILLFWLSRRRANTWYPGPAVMLILMGNIEAVGIFSLVLIKLYNGKKNPGWAPRTAVKYLFYLAYPVHILILVIVHRVLFGF